MTASIDPRPTHDIVRLVRLRDQAQAYRRAAEELLQRADEMDREARDDAYIANVAAQAERSLDRALVRRRRVAG